MTDSVFDKYQFSVLRIWKSSDCTSWKQVTDWCKKTIPRDRWIFLDYRKFVIGFSHEEDYVLCMLTWE